MVDKIIHIISLSKNCPQVYPVLQAQSVFQVQIFIRRACIQLHCNRIVLIIILRTTLNVRYVICDLGQRGPAGADGLNGDVGPKGNTVIHSTYYFSAHTV